MKKLIVVLTLAASCSFIYSQVPGGFNYQAIAHDASGKPVTTPVDVKIGFQRDTLLSTYVWEELHSGVKPNSQGLFSLVIGQGSRVSGLPAFADVDWTKTPMYIRVSINSGSGWKNMWADKLWSVPYSVIAGGLDGALEKLEVIGDDVSSGEALFEVKRKDGETMFAVYNHGVRVYMPLDTMSKARKGGFAIGGFNKAKGTVQDYFVVSPDSTRIYVSDNTGKGRKGGFAIGGFTPAKDGERPFVDLTPKNYFIGHESGSKTTGSYNAFFGYQSGKVNIEGNQNLFLGYQSGMSNKDGNYNIFIGYQAGYRTVGPSGAVGGQEGSNNCYIGNNAGFSSIYGANNTVVGCSAGYNNTADKNTFIGSFAGVANTSGRGNTFLGTDAGLVNTIGENNSFLGRDAGRNTFNGSCNTMVGSGAGANISGGSRNVIIGQGAMGENYFATTGTGTANIVIGCQAGYSLLNGSSNIFIGDQAGFDETGSNLFIVENSNSATPLIYGNFGTDDFRINGNIQYTGTIANVSDIRFKRNILPIENAMEKLGLINGIYYEWAQSDTIGLLLQKGVQIGVIAQEVEKVYPELVITTEKGYKMVDYVKLTPVLIEAIKEQQQQIDLYKSENYNLRSRLQSLEEEVAEIKEMLRGGVK